MKNRLLYDAANEHDACGVGLIVHINGVKSHDVVDEALTVLEHMSHRGAEGADSKSGDGAGIMVQIPHEFILLNGIPVPEKGRYGVGVVFLPRNDADADTFMDIIRRTLADEGLRLMHVRHVPVDSSVLGDDAARTEPRIDQLFVSGDDDAQTAVEQYEADLLRWLDQQLHLEELGRNRILPVLRW